MKLAQNIFLLLASIAFFVGCQITPEKARTICPSVKSLAERVTIRVLDSNDNEKTRKGIETAALVMRQASEDSTLSFDDLALLVLDLPFEKLEDEETRLYVDTATLAVVLFFPDGAAVDLSEREPAQIVARCIAEGMLNGLSK